MILVHQRSGCFSLYPSQDLDFKNIPKIEQLRKALCGFFCTGDLMSGAGVGVMS